MFKILQKTFRTGIVTTAYPQTAARSLRRTFAARPEFDFDAWRDAPAGGGRLPHRRHRGRRTAAHRGTVTVDYGRCIFCGECAAAIGRCAIDPRSSNWPPRAARHLVVTAEYALNPDGTHERAAPARPKRRGRRTAGAKSIAVLGRSLAIREVDAGSCNGCELEIIALNNPVYDIERFGIHFVASPRHADMLLVTGPVTRNMELALRKTYDATPGSQAGGGRGRVRHQRRHLRRQLRHARRRGPGDPGGRLHPRLPAAPGGAAPRHPAARGAAGGHQFGERLPNRPSCSSFGPAVK